MTLPCKVTLSANAGVSVSMDDVCLWFDALHDEKASVYSTVSPELFRHLMDSANFGAPDAIVYSHCHPDHFSAQLTRRAIMQYPFANVILPEEQFIKQQTLTDDTHSITVDGDTTLHCKRLVHEGIQYAHVPHYGFVLEHKGYRILYPGDCEIISQDLPAFVQAIGHIHLAILDFPWITLKRGWKTMKELICPDHIAICHLPFEEDDNVYHYGEKAEALAPTLGCDARVLRKPLQSEIFQL